MRVSIDNIRLCGFCVAVPETIDEVVREEYTDILGGERKISRLVKATGIERRPVTWDDQKTSDLGIEAVRGLMEDTGWDYESVDVLILVTQNPDELLPATSMYVHGTLPFRKDMVVFDINLGCSGFTSGLQTAAGLLKGMGLNRAILLAGDIARFEPVWKENGEWQNNVSSWLLFGSAISATAIERCDAGAEMTLEGFQTVDGTRANAIHRRTGIISHMDGKAVFSYSINEVVEEIRRFMNELKITDEDVDFYVFHQAQRMILDSMGDLLGIPEHKRLTSYRDFGNTSSASIPLSLCVNSEELTMGGRVLFCGFGVGLACSGLYMRLDKDLSYRVVRTGRKYEHIDLAEVRE